MYRTPDCLGDTMKPLVLCSPRGGGRAARGRWSIDAAGLFAAGGYSFCPRLAAEKAPFLGFRLLLGVR